MYARQRGLTLLEVMIAMMMLASGLVAIASLFPVAGTIQRRTYDDVVVNQVSDSVDDIVTTRGFNWVDLLVDDPPDVTNPRPPDLSDPTQRAQILVNDAGSLPYLRPHVRPLPARALDGDPDPSTHPVSTEWGMADRCYPSAMGGDDDYNERSYYWVPV